MSSKQEQQFASIEEENTRLATGVDDMQPLPDDEDRGTGEGEIKGSFQPKIAALEGIEYDTGNS